ncbi:MAG: RDD family protein [Solirubrobacteraceae bacterium MAG38_C4-C5]|nr:RDD family protein [Candidatus Siliceabacter maunaloa]
MRPAALRPRIAAWGLDLLITPILPFVLYLAIAALFGDDIPLAVALPIVALLLGFHLLYAPVLLTRIGDHAGQTIGKQLLGLRVTRPDDQPLDFRRALVREPLARSLLAFVPLYLVVDLLLPLLTPPRRRAMHDIIADTLVVRAE